MSTDKKTQILHRYTERLLKLGICVSVLFLLTLCVVSVVRAQIPRSQIAVAPSRQELVIDPGEVKAINVKFINQEDTPISGLLKAVDFIVEDKEGTPTFLEETITITGTTLISPRFSAASWVSLPYDRITIAGKDQVTVNAKITAPPDARPGGRYLAIYFEPGGTLPEKIGVPREAASPVAMKIAGLVYIRVSGPITEDAYVVRFAAPRFSEYGPIPITTEILNRGDYHIRPLGTITLTNMLGREVDKVELKEANIFPDVSRIFENEVGQRWMWGKYKAQLAATFGEQGKALTATVFFWVFPWKLASAIILAIIILVLLLTTFYRRIKHRQEELELKLAEEEKEIAELKEKLEKRGE